MPPITRAAAQIYRDVRVFPRNLRLPTFRGIAANSIASVIMPLGVTYQSIQLRFTIAGVPATEAQIKAQVTKIKGTIDGDPKFDASSTELLALMNFWNGAKSGITNVIDGVMTLHLSRPWEQEIVAQDGPGYGCATGVPGGVNSFQLEVTLDAGATIDNIEGFAEVTNAEPLGRHWTLRRIVDNQAASGDKVLSDWNPGVDYSIYAMHVDQTGGTGNTITDIALAVDQVEEIQKAKYGVIKAQFQRTGQQQQTGFTHIPFNRRGRPLEGLPMVFQDMRLTLTTSAAMNNFNVLLEQLEGVDPAPLAAR